MKPYIGAKHRKKILGHGRGSGHGGSSTRGTKGQRSRSGEAKRPGFEGGQTPLIRRIPKRGFTNAPFRKEYSIVNLGTLDNKFAPETEITPELLHKEGLIKKKNLPLKILAKGTLTKAFTILAHKFSKQALQKISLTGGKAVTIRC